VCRILNHGAFVQRFIFKELPMKASTVKALIALPLISLALLGLSVTTSLQAADTSPEPVVSAKPDDFAIGKKAVESKNWTAAVDSFKKAVAANPKNPDAHNMLGYSYRALNRFDESFAAYDKALAIDPKHKGALEYSGMGYLKTNQKAKAEVQLAKLKAICAGCPETTSLAKAVDDYKPGAVISTY
jgi:tetratricopeptide (TPR) repeat protein